MLVISLLELLFLYYESVEKGEMNHFHIMPFIIINTLIKLLLTVLQSEKADLILFYKRTKKAMYVCLLFFKFFMTVSEQEKGLEM